MILKKILLNKTDRDKISISEIIDTLEKAAILYNTIDPNNLKNYSTGVIMSGNLTSHFIPSYKGVQRTATVDTSYITAMMQTLIDRMGDV